MEIAAERTFNALYIYLDIAWLVVYAAILISRKRFVALVAGLGGSIIYFAVDYGIFYLAMGTRTVTGADPFWFLLWLSASYGFTNFAWIWLLLDRDGHAVEWSVLTIAGWVAVAALSQSFGSNFQAISSHRGTAGYHGVMALILAAGYITLVLRNLRAARGGKVNILRLLAIGIGVQMSWELVLLVTQIRPSGIMPLLVNSLIETNQGIPYLYLVHGAISGRFNEDLTPRAANKT
jgi:hypothetical protein